MRCNFLMLSSQSSASASMKKLLLLYIPSSGCVSLGRVVTGCFDSRAFGGCLYFDRRKFGNEKSFWKRGVVVCILRSCATRGLRKIIRPHLSWTPLFSSDTLLFSRLCLASTWVDPELAYCAFKIRSPAMGELWNRFCFLSHIARKLGTPGHPGHVPCIWLVSARPQPSMTRPSSQNLNCC